MWEDESPSAILKLVNLIPNHFKLADLFDISKGVAKNYTYVFKGAVFYWGMHYYNYMRFVRKGGE